MPKLIASFNASKSPSLMLVLLVHASAVRTKVVIRFPCMLFSTVTTIKHSAFLTPTPNAILAAYHLRNVGSGDILYPITNFTQAFLNSAVCFVVEHRPEINWIDFFQQIQDSRPLDVLLHLISLLIFSNSSSVSVRFHAMEKSPVHRFGQAVHSHPFGTLHVSFTLNGQL
nr:MAG TPA: hypothetical protein [Caudoviricetes sp.]